MHTIQHHIFTLNEYFSPIFFYKTIIQLMTKQNHDVAILNHTRSRMDIYIKTFIELLKICHYLKVHIK